MTTADAHIVARIAAFLDTIGIALVAGEIDRDTFLPAMTIRSGAVVYDPQRLTNPGDLLHEAGHVALTEPPLRATLCEVSTSPAEEMGAIAWSYAAAVRIGIDPALVFRADGYRGGGNWIAEAFAAGTPIGLPMLQWLGMAAGADAADAHTRYPHMLRWLR
ncbi:hypothetical protein OKW76_13315 [Sphingomonas sp. S1-29]|uniref:hypothetical protein n=1 Tax=Sphingomonas sp. S1-29 TaxID=2991074 RepID=UPI00223F6C16|nr:hypothetical protein [Sphingomonas sp. S1-29]UZK68992.1 hypothetical protein OKW76_13315 [Sphingomonas sp. S1-29]